MNNTEEQSSDTSKTSGSVWEQWIRKVRDNIVLISGTLYVLGYIVWSLNAAMNNMGLLPALDFQYFVAGIIPALLIYLTYHFIKLTLKTIERLRNWLYSEEQMSKEKLLVRRGVISLFYILDIGGLIYIYIFGEPSIALLYIFAPFMILLLIIVIGITPSKEVADIRHPFVKAVYQMFSHFYPIMLILSLAIMALTLYAFVWYPSLPQALGGTRPRCAYLDLTKEQVSEETLQSILPVSAIQSSQSVVRSLKVEILFSGDILVVRSKGNIFEISRDVVQVVHPCD